MAQATDSVQLHVLTVLSARSWAGTSPEMLPPALGLLSLGFVSSRTWKPESLKYNQKA